MTELKAIQRHPFHLVDSSPWPLLAGQSALALTTGFVMYLQCYQGGAYVFMFGFPSLVETIGASELQLRNPLSQTNTLLSRLPTNATDPNVSTTFPTHLHPHLCTITTIATDPNIVI